MLIRHLAISSFCVLNTPFQIKRLMNTSFSRNDTYLLIQFFVVSRAQFSLIIVRYVFAKRAVPFCLVFYNPFFFPRSKFCCKMLFEAHIFYPFSGHYLAKKIGQNFLKCCYKSNTTLPFVPYAKTKLISVLFSNVTQPPQLSAIAFSPPYFYHSPSKPMTCLPYESPIAQWLEHPTCIWKVVGLIPVKGTVSRLCARASVICLFFKRQ